MGLCLVSDACDNWCCGRLGVLVVAVCHPWCSLAAGLPRAVAVGFPLALARAPLLLRWKLCCLTSTPSRPFPLIRSRPQGEAGGGGVLAVGLPPLGQKPGAPLGGLGCDDWPFCFNESNRRGGVLLKVLLWGTWPRQLVGLLLLLVRGRPQEEAGFRLGLYRGPCCFGQARVAQVPAGGKLRWLLEAHCTALSRGIELLGNLSRSWAFRSPELLFQPCNFGLCVGGFQILGRLH